MTIVVIGGGATGVEMAGAIAELAKRSPDRRLPGMLFPVQPVSF